MYIEAARSLIYRAAYYIDDYLKFKIDPRAMGALSGAAKFMERNSLITWLMKQYKSTAVMDTSRNLMWKGTGEITGLRGFTKELTK